MKPLSIALALSIFSISALAGPPESVMNEVKLTCYSGNVAFPASLKKIMIGQGVGNTRMEDRLIENSSGAEVTHVVKTLGGAMSMSAPASYSNADAAISIYRSGYLARSGKQAEIKLGKTDTFPCDIQNQKLQNSSGGHAL
jgi:hypothetical protein